MPPPGAKRIKSLEAQVERLSEENMRQADKTSNLARQVLVSFSVFLLLVVVVVVFKHATTERRGFAKNIFW